MKYLAAALLVAAGTAALAQTSATIGLNLNPTARVIFPSKNQSTEQQNKDLQKCYDWAKTNSGIDPVAIRQQTDATITQAQQQASAQTAAIAQPTASAGRSAVRGAVAGTAIGAIAGDTGKGAAIGATAGVMSGAARRRDQAVSAQQQKQAAQQQATQAQQNAQTQLDASMQKWDKSYVTCLQGSGYSVN
jgi:hypothetical protein